MLEDGAKWDLATAAVAAPLAQCHEKLVEGFFLRPEVAEQVMGARGNTTPCWAADFSIAGWPDFTYLSASDSPCSLVSSVHSDTAIAE